MKVLMKQLAAGARGVLIPGREYDLPEAEAKGLVDGNAASFIADVVQPPELATAPAPAGVEHATAPAGKRTKHRG